MKVNNFNDTIAAIATAIGESGIGIVRISGKDALKIADQIFLCKKNIRPSRFKSFNVHHGWIVRNAKFRVQSSEFKAQDCIDEVLLTVMRAPGTYTKEDVVEINCHGGIVPLREILDLVLDCGARLAEPGEFTKRAFLNGRIDLTQAEAVLDVIRAKTEAALKVSVNNLKGGLSISLNKTRRDLLNALKHIEAGLDFPDEDIKPRALQSVLGKLKEISGYLSSLLKEAERFRVFREGISVVICGKTNVGKSSLLNLLLKQDRSLVTDIPGTTRDTIEELIDIKGIPVKITDTAGIIPPRNIVEKKAVQRSKRQIDCADLVLLMFDASRRLSREDRELMCSLKNRHCLALINKMDLKTKIDKAAIERVFGSAIEISAKRNKNIASLEEKIAGLVYSGKVSPQSASLISNTRHIRILKDAQKCIACAIHSLDNGLPAELIAQDLREALSSIDELLGKEFALDLLDKIFAEFCIGK